MTLREIADRVVRMAGENPQWGYTRIQGAHANLAHDVARNTVNRILQDHGIGPAPERSQRVPWKTVCAVDQRGMSQSSGPVHRKRNHQGLDNRLLQHAAPPQRTASNVHAATASADSSISTIEWPRDWSAY
jgi:hypothetical protein